MHRETQGVEISSSVLLVPCVKTLAKVGSTYCPSNEKSALQSISYLPCLCLDFDVDGTIVALVALPPLSSSTSPLALLISRAWFLST